MMVIHLLYVDSLTDYTVPYPRRWQHRNYCYDNIKSYLVLIRFLYSFVIYTYVTIILVSEEMCLLLRLRYFANVLNIYYFSKSNDGGLIIVVKYDKCLFYRSGFPDVTTSLVAKPVTIPRVVSFLLKLKAYVTCYFPFPSNGM
jgi:hypothetical protein